MMKVIGGLAACAVLMAAAPASADAAAYCGTVNGGFPGVVAGKLTSCGFARNVARAYMSVPGRDATVWAWSPATHRGYRMWCRPRGYSILCTGGDGARVRLVS